MSDISKISPDNGTNEYNLKDVEARKRVSESLLDDTVGWVGKNINQTVYTTKAASAASGVDWTYTDNVLDANGTATADSSNGTSFVATYTGQVTLSGCNSGDADIHLYPYDVTDSARPYTDSSKSTRLSYNDNVYNDNEISFYMEAGHSYTMTCRVKSGKTANHVKFYPMLRKAEITDKTFYPPHKSVEDWYWENNAKTGVHNFLPMLMTTIKASNTAGTWNGNVYSVNNIDFTFTVDANGYVTKVNVNGNSASAGIDVRLGDYTLSKGTYKLKCGLYTNNANTRFALTNASGTYTEYASDKDGEEVFTLSSDSVVRPRLYFASGDSRTNVDLYPEIVLSNDTYDGHTDYSMTNAELTEKVQGIINAANNSADFAAFKTAIAAL